MSDSPTGSWRTKQTWLLYISISIVGFAMNGMGSILLPLQKELGVDRSRTSLYPTFFAVALVVIGLVGGRIAGRIGIDAMNRLGLGFLLGGVLLLCTSVYWLTLVGALLIGTGCAIFVQTVNAGFAREHGDRAAVATNEGNAMSSVVSLTPALLVSGALASGLGWRVGYLLPIAMAALGLLLQQRGTSKDAVTPVAEVRPEAATANPAPLLPRWIDLILPVSAEFSMVYWSADALFEWYDLRRAAAVALASSFLIGMAIGRILGTPFIARNSARRVVVGCCSVALIGLALFWASPVLIGNVAGAVVTGVGISLLYPVLVSRLIAARPDNVEHTAALGALASGIAVGVAPLVLAQFSRVVDLRIAFLLVPTFVAVLLIRWIRDPEGAPSGT